MCENQFTVLFKVFEESDLMCIKRLAISLVTALVSWCLDYCNCSGSTQIDFDDITNQFATVKARRI